MAKVFIEETTLTAIGDAIRGKTGKTELIDPANMSTEIASIEAGSGGGDLPSKFIIAGDCTSRFHRDGWTWFINDFGDRIVTSDITSATKMFEDCKSREFTSVPFDINFSSSATSFEVSEMFDSCFYVTELPRINFSNFQNTTSVKLKNLLYACQWLTTEAAENLFDLEQLNNYKPVITSTSSHNFGSILYGCYSLRTVPTWFYKFWNISEESSTLPTSSNGPYYALFQDCIGLHEIRLPVVRIKTAITSNLFSSTFKDTSSLNSLVFDTVDGQPYVVEWKAQTIDLYSGGIGYDGYSFERVGGYLDPGTKYKVTDDASYQALKNDPDWWTRNVAYSRYNHDSAVETINSLPDTSAYLASAGGTNTIKFKGTAGSATDGGAINTLTAEEIAVATAKGWTVTLA